jgi:ribonucleoside-diphosphate reductase alpha chain
MTRKNCVTDSIVRFAEYLLQRNIPYDSKEALDEIDDIMGKFKEYAVEQTRELAREKGVFPAWNLSVFAENDDKRRNAFTTSIAPTGKSPFIPRFFFLRSRAFQAPPR